MRRRTEPRSIPESPIYVRVTMPGRTQHVLRVPSTTDAMVVFQRVDSAKLTVLGDALANATTIGALLTAIQQMGPDVLGAYGYLIGHGWRHPDLDLEAVLAVDGDPLAYGRAVLEELHEWGYSLNEQVMLGTVVLADWTRRHAAVEEAEQKRGFFPQTPAASIS